MRDAKTQSKRPIEINHLRLVAVGFFVVAVWMGAASLYSRYSIAPALRRMAPDPAKRDEARRLIYRATRLVFGRGIFAARLTRLGDVPQCISNRTGEVVWAEVEQSLAEARKTAARLALLPDASEAAQYGRACAKYVARIAALQSQDQSPPQSEVAAEILRYVEGHAFARFSADYGEPAAALIREFLDQSGGKPLSDAARTNLNERWNRMVEAQIEDFASLAAINGRNGFVFGGFLFLVSLGFLLISVFGRAIIPQEGDGETTSDERRPQ